MSELRATKGPYRIETVLMPVTDELRTEIVTYAFDVVSAHRGIRRDADAHLLAASWELYEALEALRDSVYSDVEHWDHSEDQLIQAEAALAKARGEG